MLDTLTSEALILGPRPGKKSIDRLSALALTHCVTLLSEREDVAPIKKICGKLGCQWLWMPIDGGNLDALRAMNMPLYIQQLHDALEGVEQPKVYVHCSAGIHRTGYFAYGLLRVMGQPPEEARATLSDLREVTAAQVGADRLDLADEMLEKNGLLG